MLELPLTAMFAAVFAILLIPLTIQVGIKRNEMNIFFGHGGDLTLARRRAAQSNYTQYVPFLLVLLAICEIGGASYWLEAATGGSMLIGRLLHAYCMLYTDGLGNTRAAGMLLTMLSYLIAGGYLGWNSVQTF